MAMWWYWNEARRRLNNRLTCTLTLKTLKTNYFLWMSRWFAKMLWLHLLGTKVLKSYKPKKDNNDDDHRFLFLLSKRLYPKLFNEYKSRCLRIKWYNLKNCNSHCLIWCLFKWLDSKKMMVRSACNITD